MLYRIQSFNIVKCKNCGVIYNKLQPSSEELRQLYDDRYFRSETPSTFGYLNYLSAKDHIVRLYRPRLDIIERKYKKSGRLLDIGCATGFFLQLARERGWQVQGVEISKYATDYAKHELGLDVFQGSLEETTFNDEYFDVVTMWDTLMHLPNPYETIVEVNRILKCGGVLALDTANMNSLNCKLLGKNWSVLQKPQEHIYYFSANTLKKLLEKCNFEVMEKNALSSPLSLADFYSLKSILPRTTFFLHLIGGLLDKFGLDSKDELVVYAIKPQN